jgi:hypothetical protein
MDRLKQEQVHEPPTELLPIVQPNTVLVKGAPDQLKAIQELKGQGMSFTVVDIDVYRGFRRRVSDKALKALRCTVKQKTRRTLA